MFLEDNDFDFPGGTRGFGHSLRSHTINNWIPVAVAAISAAGAIAGALASSDDGGGDYPEPKILPETVSGNVMQELEFMFDQEAAESMQQFAEQLTEWGVADRTFFDTQWQPFQQDLIKTNQSLLPVIERNATEALNQNVKDLLGSEHLKASFRNNVTNMGSDIGSLARNFAQQIDAIPGEDQRVSAALADVEKQFGKAGAELKRSMNAQGVGVSEASKRDLAISKASAKAGAGDTAAEAARREKLQATAEGVGVLSGVQSGQSQQLLGQVGATQASATLLPQVGGVKQLEGVSKAAELGAGLTQAGAEKMLGQTSDTAQASFTQVGIKDPLFMSKTTSAPVTSTGEEFAPPVVKPVVRPPSSAKDVNTVLDSGGPGVGGADSEATGGFGGGGGSGGNGSPGIGGGNGPGGGAGSGVCCFISGTQVMTKSGAINIEDIKPGFEVYSYNFLNGKQIWSAVKSTLQVLRSGYYEIVFESGQMLGVTNDHPMWTSRGWQAIDSIAARENSGYNHLYRIDSLVVGSYVSMYTGGFDKVIYIDHVPGEVTTYTLRDVAPAKNFYANGYLASNKI
jgi:hypothetical protein